MCSGCELERRLFGRLLQLVAVEVAGANEHEREHVTRKCDGGCDEQGQGRTCIGPAPPPLLRYLLSGNVAPFADRALFALAPIGLLAAMPLALTTH